MIKVFQAKVCSRVEYKLGNDEVRVTQMPELAD